MTRSIIILWDGFAQPSVEERWIASGSIVQESIACDLVLEQPAPGALRTWMSGYRFHKQPPDRVLCLSDFDDVVFVSIDWRNVITVKWNGAEVELKKRRDV